jgi:hypothetical protein
VVYDIFKEGGCKRYWFILGWRREIQAYVIFYKVGCSLMCIGLGRYYKGITYLKIFLVV